MKYLFTTIIVTLLSSITNAQSKTSLEDKLASTACKYIDSLNLSKIVTPKDKKAAITFIFSKAVATNQQAIDNDKRFAGLKNYDQGKKLGQMIAQNIFPAMNTRCPKFKKLIN